MMRTAPNKISHVIILLFIMGFSYTAMGQEAGWNYISPQAGSKFVNPENNIALRHGDVLDQSTVKSGIIEVNGSKSGKINGEVILSNDNRTLIFKPEKDYAYGEKVSVTLGSGISTGSGENLPGKQFSFYTAKQDNYELIKEHYKITLQEEEGNIQLQQATSSEPHPLKNTNANDYPEGLPLPTIYEYNHPAPGYIFSGSRPYRTEKYDPYLMIVDNYGTPVFYRNWPRRANDFKAIVNNQLAFCDFDNSNPVINKYLVMDSHFNLVDTLTMGNGYIVDQHDLLMRDNGNHFLMAYDPQIVNMDTVVPGGDTAATVIGFIIQELDAGHNVVFQWRSWDHYEITDANHTDFTGSRVDYVHGNAFEIDHDGDLLISCRNMEEITKISLETGEIIWRLGVHAKNNMFDFGNDTIGFSWQHDIRRLENGNITVYDNGNYHTPSFSQALEYEIDEVNYTAEKVWNYIHDPVVFARATGSHRRLQNDNAFICWGLTWPINVSEVTPEGDLAWELHWPDSVWDYRSFKFQWETDFFEVSLDTIDFGEYDDYVPWPRVFTITNNTGQDIEITSTHNHWDSYYVSTSLPLTIPANGDANMTVEFYPTTEGQINDVLTISYESSFMDTLPQMISRQIYLKGSVEDQNGPTASSSPADAATDVPQDAQIMIKFNEPVVKANGETFTAKDIAGVFSLRENDAAGEDVGYSAYINAWKTKIIITPDTLKPQQDYYLHLEADMLKDKQDNLMAQAYTATFTTGEQSAIEELVRENIRLYPNPTNGLIRLEIDRYHPEEIRVLNVKGETVLNINDPEQNNIALDLSHQASGVYFVEITLEELQNPVSIKIIKN